MEHPPGFARLYTPLGHPPEGVYFINLKSYGGAKDMVICQKKIARSARTLLLLLFLPRPYFYAVLALILHAKL